MAGKVVIGDLRVQEMTRTHGGRSWTVVWPEGTVHREADRFLREHEGSGTQRTYAYLLVDHLRWLERECLALERVALGDLERYMGLLGAKVCRTRPPVCGPFGVLGGQRRGGLGHERGGVEARRLPEGADDVVQHAAHPDRGVG